MKWFIKTFLFAMLLCALALDMNGIRKKRQERERWSHELDVMEKHVKELSENTDRLLDRIREVDEKIKANDAMINFFTNGVYCLPLNWKGLEDAIAVPL